MIIFVGTLEEQLFAFVDVMYCRDYSLFSRYLFLLLFFFFRSTDQGKADFLAILVQFVDSYCLIMLMNETIHEKINITVSFLKICMN